MIHHVLEWRDEKGRRRRYRTKQETSPAIRERYRRLGIAYHVLRYDTSVDWPLGVYAEVLERWEPER